MTNKKTTKNVSQEGGGTKLGGGKKLGGGVKLGGGTKLGGDYRGPEWEEYKRQHPDQLFTKSVGSGRKIAGGRKLAGSKRSQIKPLPGSDPATWGPMPKPPSLGDNYDPNIVYPAVMPSEYLEKKGVRGGKLSKKQKNMLAAAAAAGTTLAGLGAAAAGMSSGSSSVAPAPTSTYDTNDWATTEDLVSQLEALLADTSGGGRGGSNIWSRFTSKFYPYYKQANPGKSFRDMLKDPQTKEIYQRVKARLN